MAAAKGISFRGLQIMKKCLAVFALGCLVAIFSRSVHAGEEEKGPLEGVWVAESMEIDGKPAPEDAVKRMRFTFRGDKLLLRGNAKNDQEDECRFRLDLKASPKQLDFTPPKGEKPILGIYEVKDDQLRVCLRHSSSDQGRPTEFATKPETQLALIVFKKQKE